MYPVKWSLKALLLFLIFQFSTSIDTITPNYSLKDGDVLVSSGQIFTLGFFSPGNSKYRYVGIWYSQVPEQTVVWVANRNNPINDTSGVLAINGLGNLVLYEKNQTVPLWSTNVSVTAASNTMAELLDSGNLVLVHNDTKRVSLWQSFDYPTDTVLPYMKIGLDRRTGLNRFTTSWRSQDDPGTGNFSCRIDPSGFPQLYLYKSSDPWWRAGSWTGQRWSGVPRMTHKDLFNSSYVNDQNETSIMWWSVTTNASILSRMVIYESGLVQRFTWNDQDRRWIGFWSEPSEPCNYYGHCGANSNCDPYIEDKFECTCLPGFEPKSSQEWFLRDGSGGCVRKSGVSTCKSGEGFVKVALVKVPDTSMASVNMSLGLKACEEECLRNCSCMAYGSAYEGNKGGTGCLTWHANLVDTRTYSNSGQDLFVRVDAVELAHYANNGSLGKKGLTKILIPSIVAIIIMVTFVYWLVKKRREERGHSKHSFSFTPSSPYFEDSPSRMELDGNKKKIDLPLFDLSTIAAATDNFSPDNKLGEGGFGPVYKGVLSNGREIAVKRLSKYSGQGIGEFKNEIALIARLQHRNLVRILGCCIDKEEKMLLYEYLPNQSLDSFIFGETKRPMLNWRKRFEIICGVARGILYLHHDSRLRIIHRDLKASNVLLDAAMDPKISDFGMARIFGGDQVQANTNRVVGTYGYMSPEYAMEGIFSIKSDVYSFGVLLLEIITGRKINGDYPDCLTSNLVGHVWNLWREGKVMEIIDSSLGESYLANEVLRCIHIGLLCVQEHATDRPTMSTIVSMLGNDTVLPSPRQPAFIIRSGGGTTGTSSVNDVTITVVQGR